MTQSDEDIFNTTGIRLKDAFVVIVKTSWNSHVTDLLLEGCVKKLDSDGVAYTILEVPGAFEIPFAIQQYHQHNPGKAQAFIALGCIIRGNTPHFEYISQSVTQGLTQLNISLGFPVIFGVLTVNSQVQADERTGGRQGHKGEEAAATAIQMIALSNAIKNA